MNRMLCGLAILTIFSVCYAANDDSGYGTVIAVEVRVNGQFNGVVGKLEYTGTTVDLVTFSLHERIIVLPEVCEVREKTITAKGVHHIRCQNQYGAITSGTIDFRDRSKPQITLVRQGGHVLTNISKEGKEMQMKYIPTIDLGF